MKMQGVDTLGASAGAAAAESAGEFVEQMFGHEVPDEVPPPTAAEEPQGGDEPPAPSTEESPELPDPLAPQPLPIKADETVPDHVVRKGDKAIATWKQMRAELDAAEQRASDIERDRLLKDQELEELKKKLETAPPEAKVKELETKLQDAEDYIGRLDLTQSKVFQEQYDAPLNELFGKVVRTFMKSGSDQQSAIDLARKVFRPGMSDPAKLEPILSEFPAVVTGAVSAILEDREILSSKRDEAIQNWRQSKEASDMEERRRTSTEVGQQLTRAADVAFEAVVKDGSWLFKPGQDPKWNEGVEVRKNAALGYLRAGKPEDIARLVMEGIASPTYRKSYEQLKVRYDSVVAQLDAVTKGRPGLAQRASSSPVASPAAEGPKTPGSVVDEVWQADD